MSVFSFYILFTKLMQQQKIIGQLAVLVLREQRIVDDRAIGALRLELLRSFAQVGRVPKARSDLAALRDDLLLLHQLGEQDVEGSDRHDDQDREDRDGDNAALLKGGDQPIRICRRCGGCCLHKSNFLLKIPLKT